MITFAVVLWYWEMNPVPHTSYLSYVPRPTFLKMYFKHSLTKATPSIKIYSEMNLLRFKIYSEMNSQLEFLQNICLSVIKKNAC
jgi:hypothetical protein